MKTLALICAWLLLLILFPHLNAGSFNDLASYADRDVASRTCFDGNCSYLIRKNGIVKFVRTGAIPVDRTVGPYLRRYQDLVPEKELPVVERHFSNWRIVVSAALVEEENNGPIMRFRFWGSDGELLGSYDGDLEVLGLNLGTLFGGNDVVAIVTTSGVHVYDNKTIVWLFSDRKEVRTLLELPGSAGRVIGPSAGNAPRGLWVKRQLYDGVHAETKREIPEFWKWQEREKKMTRR